MSTWAKENYFENGTEEISNALIAEIDSLRAKHSITPDFDKMAFLVMDFQKAYLDPDAASSIPAAKEVVDNIKSLINKFPDNLFIFTRHLNTKEDAGNFKKWWRKILTKEDPESELFFSPGQNTVVLEKTRYDAFYDTKLEEVLKKNEIKQLVMVGTMTNLCCESTARSAFDRGFEVFYLVDAMATRNLVLHQASVYSAAHGFAYPLTTAEFLKLREEIEDAANLS